MKAHIPLNLASRAAPGTNPEELIGAAEAGCFSMALSSNLEKAGHPAKRISTTANVKLEMVEGGPKITPRSSSRPKLQVPGMDDKAFQEQARRPRLVARSSRALAGNRDKLKAKLL